MGIKFKGEQTPLIYDPMSVIDYGYASCTGLSILLVDALRSVGVPARIAGTPAWHGNVSDGNHNWVEVWLGPGQGLHGEAWSFIESKPAGGNENFTDPCDKWFCNPSHFDGKTEVFAAQYDRTPPTPPMPPVTTTKAATKAATTTKAATKAATTTKPATKAATTTKTPPTPPTPPTPTFYPMAWDVQNENVPG